MEEHQRAEGEGRENRDERKEERDGIKTSKEGKEASCQKPAGRRERSRDLVRALARARGIPGEKEKERTELASSWTREPPWQAFAFRRRKGVKEERLVLDFFFRRFAQFEALSRLSSLSFISFAFLSCIYLSWSSRALACFSHCLLFLSAHKREGACETEERKKHKKRLFFRSHQKKKTFSVSSTFTFSLCHKWRRRASRR